MVDSVLKVHGINQLFSEEICNEEKSNDQQLSAVMEALRSLQVSNWYFLSSSIALFVSSGRDVFGGFGFKPNADFYCISSFRERQLI